MGRRDHRPRTGPRTPRPHLRRVAFADGSHVVFEVAKGTTTRAAVQTRGIPRYVLGAAARGWKPWPVGETPVWARSWGRPEQLSAVPLADPDPARDLRPAAFEVSASTWCSWPVDARESLRAVTAWAKVPGAVSTAELDGPTAQRVRDLAAQRGLEGLEEHPLAAQAGGHDA
jgi:hypothetical protein